MMEQRPQPYINAVSAEPETNTWSWRNCRSFAVGIRFWLWPWAVGVDVSEDRFGGERHLYIGPLDLSISYSVGT